MIPGSNRLAQASRLIALSPLQYLQFLSRSTGANGMLIPVYAAIVNVKGSIQAVPRTLMELLGLDMQRNYVNIYISQNVIDIQRDVTSDKFIYQGTIFQALSITRWVQIDGWNAVLCVEVPS